MYHTILVTGGAGYIGSHTCISLLEAGYEVVVVDNFSNSNPLALKRVQEISHRSLNVYSVDICDRAPLKEVFLRHKIDAVIHFAGLKAVGESVEKPLAYYRNNVYGSIVLSEVMAAAGVKTLIFSSSATVYGMSENVPFKEDAPTSATNPYGRTKLFIEEILRDICVADPEWSVTLLRYFNPVGAHPCGKIGEDPSGIPNNLMPYISQVAVGRRDKLTIFGKDYPTPDGTGVRDFIHVCDLAEGHVRALEKIRASAGISVFNLGTGRGYSVLDVVKSFEATNKIKIPYIFAPRRPGDIAVSYADPQKAKEILGWEVKRNLEDMVRDAWNWQKKNPEGYA
jgi:UDP-glucose 4-epimerase